MKSVILLWSDKFDSTLLHDSKLRNERLEEVLNLVQLLGPRPKSQTSSPDHALFARFVRSFLEHMKALQEMMELETQQVVSMAGAEPIVGDSLVHLWEAVGNSPDRDSAMTWAIQAHRLSIRNLGQACGRTDKYVAALVAKLEKLDSALNDTAAATEEEVEDLDEEQNEVMELDDNQFCS